MANKTLPLNITSYDLLKTLALIAMLISHIGFYFYDNETWFRVIGRLSFPIWAFLIGYARTRDLPLKIWVGGGIVLASSMIAGEAILPLNILFSALIIRILLDPIVQAATKGFEALALICTILLCAVIPTFVISDYGAQGVLLAMVGYFVRNKPVVPHTSSPEAVAKVFTLFVMSQYFVIQSLMFGMSLLQMLVLAAELMAVYAVLYEFRPLEFARLTQELPKFITIAIQIMGRRSLEIYVAHLILFKALAMLTQPEKFQFMNWQLSAY